MTRDDIVRALGLTDAAEILILPDGSWVEIDFFVNLFSGAESFTYAELCRVDSGRLGYVPFFDEWKEKGLIE